MTATAPERETRKQHRQQRREVRGGPVRRTVAAVLVFLFVVLLPITLAATWTHRTVLNTDAYVSTLAPIAADPAVTAAASRELTNEIFAALDPQAVIAGALPPKATFLAGPISTAAKGQVQQAVDTVLASDRFQRLWTEVNRFAHTQVVAVLRGHTKVLQTTNGNVVLNFVPLLDAALANASGFVSGVVGRQVQLPDVTATEAPAAACARISAAIDRPLPSTCGQVPLFNAKKLHSAQRAVQIFDRAVLALLIVTPLVFLGAIFASKRRRRTLLQLTLGGMLGLVVVRRAALWEQDQLVNAGRPANHDARRAIVHGLLNGFFDLTWWFLLGGLIIAVVALLTGPYRWAGATRRWLGAGWHHGRALTAAAVTGSVSRPEDQPALIWVREHFDALRLGGFVVAFVLLLVVSLNFWTFVAIAAVVALYEVGLHRLRPPPSITLPSQPAAPPPA